MLIDTNDHRLSARDRNTLREIAIRLQGGFTPSRATERAPLMPQEMEEEMHRVFGTDAPGNTDRWQPGEGQSSETSEQGPVGANSASNAQKKSQKPGIFA